MYLHIGNNVTIRTCDITAVFDCDTSTISNKTKEFLKLKSKEKKLISDIQDIPKSFILTDDGNVYMSTFASGVITSRILQAEQLFK